MNPWLSHNPVKVLHHSCLQFKMIGWKLYLDVVTISESSKLLLAGGVPHVEADGASVGVEHERVHLQWEQILQYCSSFKKIYVLHYLHSQCGHVLLLELSRQMPLDEGSLAGAAVTHQHQFEGGHVLSRRRHCCSVLRVIYLKSEKT